MAIVIKHREVVCSGSEYECRKFIKNLSQEERDQYKMFTELPNVNTFECLILDSTEIDGVINKGIQLHVTDNGTVDKQMYFYIVDASKPQGKQCPYTSIEGADVVLTIDNVSRLVTHLQSWLETPHYLIKMKQK